jgi:UDP-N-acetylglucosamine 2-epimerase (non-hydrolysing)
MKVALILGTRPEIIKLSPVIRGLQHRNADFFILHTGQHYTDSLTSIFFDEIELPRPE